MIKNFILDTNILLHDCQAIFNFDDNNVIIPMTVIEELDNFKKEMNELGRNARQFSKIMDSLREQGSLIEGVKVGSGTVSVSFSRQDALNLLPSEMDTKIADNRILAIALFTQKHDTNPTILVTKDINLRIKADALGIAAESYENDKVDFDTLYSGYTEFLDQLNANQFVFKGAGSDLRRYDKNQDMLVSLKPDLDAWGLSPRNTEQKMAMDLLLNDEIKLVTLVGKAGTGKTLLSIAAGLRKVTDEFIYKKMLVSRPVFPMGKDIGFLPGDINEKLAPYMQPIYDNIEYLMSGHVAPKVKGAKIAKRLTKEDNQAQAVQEEKEYGKLGKGHMELVAAGIMDIEALTYIRGRSIPNQYMIIDEAQNLTPHEIKTIITRAGINTKLIFTGDPAQIDNPYLDASSNGLTYLVEKFKDEVIAGHVTLTQGERSELAEIASNIL
jgi:PhoH-like ATPase